MAPEVLRGGERYHKPCDVYSFGILLWAMITRKRPYNGMDPAYVNYQIGIATLLRPELTDSIPLSMQELLER